MSFVLWTAGAVIGILALGASHAAGEALATDKRLANIYSWCALAGLTLALICVGVA